MAIRLLITGGTGLVGSALVEEFSKDSNYEVLSPPRSELDLLNKENVLDYLRHHSPDGAIMAAAKVGGIQANKEDPVDFLSLNLEMQNNFLSAAYKSQVNRLVFLGSSCIYPKFAATPIKEESLLTGPLEPTNEAYAIAKISGVKLIQSYARQHGMNWTSVMPTNVYGDKDNFENDDSHVMPALIRRFLEAQKTQADQATVWGTGKPLREFIHAEDLARAIKLVYEKFEEPGPLNIGSGQELSIEELAKTISSAIGFSGEIVFDESKPDGTPRKNLDWSRIKELGFTPQIPLESGIKNVIAKLRSTNV